jgi:hypothetical protein
MLKSPRATSLALAALLPAAIVAAETPFKPVIDVHHTMEWITYPAAEVIWDSAGQIIDKDGEHDLSPTTEEGWENVARNAAILAESGNLLMLPGRAAGDDWVAYSAQLVTAASEALDAAENRDAAALFDAGGEVYQACVACHEKYWVKLEDRIN